jgi:hypothetical protein
MASMTDYAGYQFHLEMVDGSGTIPSTFYVALLRATPSLVDGTGGNEVDPAVNTWYTARPDATWNTASSSGRSLSNTSTVQHTASAASGISGNITCLGIYDSATPLAGNLWFVLPLTSVLSVSVATPIIWPAGQIVHEWLAT